MKSRIIINLILAFILLPIIKLIHDYISIEINKNYSQFSGSFLEYEKIIALTVFVIIPIIFLIFVLLPYNIIILKKKLALLNKVILFFAIVIINFCLLGTFMNIWVYPYWRNLNYLFYLIPYSFLFAGLIHLSVDTKAVRE